MNELLASFKNLSHIATQASLFVNIFKVCSENDKYINKIKLLDHFSGIPLDKAITGSLASYSIIICVSFFDEYNEEFTPHKHPIYRSRLVNLKELTKPILRRLAKWPHLKDYRNNILAHNLRIKGTSIFENSSISKEYKIPFSISEIVLLVNMTRIVLIQIREEFPEFLINLDWSETISSKTDVKSEEVNVNKEIEGLNTQIKSIKSSLA